MFVDQRARAVPLGFVGDDLRPYLMRPGSARASWTRRNVLHHGSHIAAAVIWTTAPVSHKCQIGAWCYDRDKSRARQQADRIEGC
jgi:hypothetical protein